MTIFDKVTITYHNLSSVFVDTFALLHSKNHFNWKLKKCEEI